MNEIRHVMLPKLDDPPKIIKHQPWYKERIKNKYLSNKNNKQTGHKNPILDTKQWLFVKDGLDDFRDGMPPPHDDIFLKPNKGPGPNLKNDDRIYKKSVLPPVKRYTVDQRCYSKALPLVEAKRERINQLIYGLTQHPLALYSHLEEALPSDLFEEIIDLLDPDMNNINNTDDNSDDNEKSHSVVTSPSFKTRENSSIFTRQKTNFEDRRKTPSEFDRSNATSAATIKVLDENKNTIRNTYKWLLKKEEEKANAKGPNSEELKAQAIDNHIKNVTETFCDWIKELGGNDHNIDPVTLTSLFASGYETKPALSVPIHVVELTNIPPELRDTATAISSHHHEETLNEKLNDDYEPKTNRQRYGAWYLPKQLWRRMPANEKLIDPKLTIDKDKEEAKKKVDEMNARLAPLHGTHAFRDFAKNKNINRIPKMIEEIDQLENEELIKETINDESSETSEHFN